MKIRIAVRMPDRSRRLYVVDAVPGMSPDEMIAATRGEVPQAQTVLVEVPKFPTPPPELRVA